MNGKQLGDRMKRNKHGPDLFDILGIAIIATLILIGVTAPLWWGK